MAYTYQNFKNGDILSAEQLVAMEKGIIDITPNSYKHTAAECVNAFVQEMNAKASALGAMHSTFVDPIGVANRSTAYDMGRILLNASSYDKIYDIWNTPTRELKLIQPDGTTRGLSVTSTVTAGAKSATLLSAYNVMGGKTGSLSAHSTYNILVICQSATTPSDWYIVAAMLANSDDSGDENRFQAAKEIMDAIEAGNTNLSVCCGSAYAIKKPAHNARAFRYTELLPAYEKNINTELYPASTTKILTSLILLDYVPNLKDKVTVSQDEIDLIEPDSFYKSDILVGETITYEDLLYAMLLPSSNAAAMIVARNVGERILRSKSL